MKEPIAGPVSVNPELLARLRPCSDSGLTKARQLYLGFYSVITSGALPRDHQLPASRTLADLLGIGRNTVVAVYRQLDDEGLVASEGRRGTRVRYQATAHKPEPRPTLALSQRASSTAMIERASVTLAPGEPDSSLFPQRAWRQALAKVARMPSTELGYRSSPMPGLQSALARYLATYRSLQVNPEQILITSSTRQSLLLAATLFADAGENAWVELPGYTGAVEAFSQQGLTLEPVPIDEQGLCVPSTASIPRLIYVTPCFQYPTGVTLSTARRDALLAFADAHSAVIFEDDYDSEFRDDTQPRPALAADGGRVLHAGTFSKLMFPAARLAWLVLPESLMPVASSCLRSLGGGHNSVAQGAVAELLDNGTIAQFLTRARGIYARRRERMLELVSAVPEFASSPGSRGSLSQVLPIKHPVPLVALESALTVRELGALPIERLYWNAPTPTHCHTLVVGLGNVDTLGLPDAVERLAEAVRAAAS